MVHANGVEPVRIAVLSGCRSVEHGFFMGRENVSRMADREVFWAPTAVTMKMYGEYRKAGSLESDTANRNLEHQLKQIAVADRLGVPMVLGTDSGSLGVFHGRSAAEELKLMLEAGLSLSRAVQCATFQGSRLLDIPDLGTVRSGKRAVFTIMDGPPEEFRIHMETIRGLS
jgi:imidazolonepropionase-like amidohydrolase